MLRGNDQAFPGPASARGIDVRTWLAGMALAGLAGHDHTEAVADEAVKIADAVLRRLNGGEKASLTNEQIAAQIEADSDVLNRACQAGAAAVADHAKGKHGGR